MAVKVRPEAMFASWWITVQGKPVVRRGRKARGLLRKTARLPGSVASSIIEVNPVKAILARFTLAVSLLAMTALTLGAGVKWDWWT